MAMDLVIDLKCEPKTALGRGNADDGTRKLLSLVKARSQAAYVRHSAENDGRDPQTVSVKVVSILPDGSQTARDVSLLQLEAEAAELDTIASACATCPVNKGGRPAGCVGIVNYPVLASAEQWLMDRVQPPDSVGGFLMLSAIRDFKYTGEVTQGYRRRKLFEAATPVVRPLPENSFKAAAVSSDQLFHALLGVGPKLNPWHLGMVLTWLGALGVDGYVPNTPEQFDMLVKLTPEQRQERTQPNLGDPSPEPGPRSMQGLLYRMYVAWTHDLPMVVDA